MQAALTTDVVRVVIERVPPAGFNIHSYLPSLLGVVVGATIAFIGWRFQKRLAREERQHRLDKEKKDKEDHDLGTCVEALFAVSRIWDFLLDIRPTLRKLQSDEKRWFKLPEMPHVEAELPSIDIASLSPILLNTHADLLFHLSVLQGSFARYTYSIRLYAVKRMQLADMKIANQPTVHIENHLLSLTDHIFDGFDELIISLKAQRDGLNKVISEKFPGRPVPHFLMTDEDGLKPSSKPEKNK